MERYSVSVGNIGNIECKNKRDAACTYNGYVRDSKLAYGRGAQEDVVLVCDGEPIQEFSWYDWRIAKQEVAVTHCRKELAKAVLIRNRLKHQREEQ